MWKSLHLDQENFNNWDFIKTSHIRSSGKRLSLMIPEGENYSVSFAEQKIL